MFWAERIPKVAGVVLLVFAALVVVSIALDLGTTDANPLARGDTETMLRDIDDNRTMFVLVTVGNMATDAVATLALAAVLYLLFRDRSQTLALFAAFGLVAGGIGFVTTDAATSTLAYLAADFVDEGGPGGIGAGDPVILQAARTVGTFSMLSALAAFTSVGFGIVAVGTLVAVAPEGATNPPRWLGALAIVSGLVAGGSWVATANFDVGMAILFIGMAGMIVFLVVLGGWLLFRGEPAEAPRASGVPQAR
ncbi:MAG: hypothetical protein Kow0010_05230 [Dehalococcoidia bacterium]